MGLFVERIAIDLGTTYSVVAKPRSEQFLRLASAVALDADTKVPVAFGDQAKRMIGRNHDALFIIQPIREGVISDFSVCSEYLRYLVKRAKKSWLALKYDLLLCVPWCATPVELEAYKQNIVGPRTNLHLVREPFAAAVGCGADIFSPEPITVVDIGGGTVEVSTIVHGHLVLCSSSRGAGNAYDQCIRDGLWKHREFSIGLNTAEELKIQHGNVYPEGIDYAFEVKGQDRVTALPRTTVVTTDELREYIEPMSQKIAEQIRAHLRKLPLDLQNQTFDRGLYIAGGGALLRGWKLRLEKSLRIPVIVPPDPLHAVIRGMQKMIQKPFKYLPVFRISEEPVL